MPPSGNIHTCNAQGFIIQFGNISNVLYMVALQIQYVLTIKYGWNDTKMKKLEGALLGVPPAFGSGTAITALVLDLYNPADWDCWIAPYPGDCTSTFEINKGNSDLEETDCIRGNNASIYQWAFFFAPLWTAIVFCIGVMAVVVKSVKKVEERTARAALKSNRISRLVIRRPSRRSGDVPHPDARGDEENAADRQTIDVQRQSPSAVRFTLEHTAIRQTTETPPANNPKSDLSAKNNLPRRKKPKLALTSRVKAQSVLYALGFFIVWSFPTMARFIQLIGGTMHPILGVLAGCFIGSQGLWNAIIYFRPKYNKIDKDHWWQKIWVLIRSTLLCCVDFSAIGISLATTACCANGKPSTVAKNNTESPALDKNEHEIQIMNPQTLVNTSWVDNRYTFPCVDEEKQDFEQQGGEYPI